MTGNYDAVAKFIRYNIVDEGLEINPLTRSKSAITAILRGFEALNWTAAAVSPEGARYPRYEITSPDGSAALSTIGGKVYRHPEVTEQICRRKHLTKRMLDLAGVPVPPGGDFSPEEKEVAAAFFEKMPKPAVVKPADSGSSQGVTVGIREQAQFDDAWRHALDGGRRNSSVLLEQFVRGVELRAYVIGDDVVSVVARVQPYVVGTGVSSVQSLIDELHQLRQVNSRAQKMPVIVDWEFVASQGYAAHSAPANSEVVFLNPFCYPTVGASIVDVTSNVSPGIKDMARRAKDAIPHLELGGVDLLVEDIVDARSAHVVEVNTSAALDMHRYPTHGSPRPIEDDVVRYFHEQHLKGAAVR